MSKSSMKEIEREVRRSVERGLLILYKISALVFFAVVVIFVEKPEEIKEIPVYIKGGMFFLAMLNMSMLNIKKVVSED